MLSYFLLAFQPAPFSGPDFQIFLSHWNYRSSCCLKLSCLSGSHLILSISPSFPVSDLGQGTPLCLIGHSFLFCSQSYIPAVSPPPVNFTWRCNFCSLALSELSAYGPSTTGQWLSLQVLFEKLPGLIIRRMNLQCSPLARHN